MSEGALAGAPSSVLDSIPITGVDGLNKVDVFSTTILPVDLADFAIVMKKIKATLTAAATTASCVDLTDSTSRDGDLVDFLFGKRLATAVGVPEFTAVG